MSRPRLTVSIAFAAGFMLAVILLVAAHLGRPSGVDASEEVDALSVALAAPLAREARAGTAVLYVRSDLDFMLVPKLRENYSAIRFHEWKDRPPDDGCKSPKPGVIVMAPCERPDYVAAQVTSTPLWRTFQVTVGQYNGGCDLVLVKLYRRWRIISERCTVI